MSVVDLEKLYAIAGGEAERLAVELCGLTVVLDDNFTIDNFLADKNMALENRQEILRAMMAEASGLLKELTELLLKEGLWRRLRVIKDDFVVLVEKKLGIRFAELRSAFPLAPDVLKLIKDKLGPNVRYNLVEDKGLLGGFIVTFNDGKTLDASVRGKLEQIRMEIAR